MTEDTFLSALLSGLPKGRGLVVGPGDDCAAVTCGAGQPLLLLKTDCVVEDVHFLRSHDPERVGWKALCRPLSDIAAMGGDPGQALVTLFSPPDVPANYWERVYTGLRRAAREFRVGIAGGELSRQLHGIAISIALTGTVAERSIVLRSGGKPGDRLFVTGRLGGSLVGHHLDFHPRLAEGRWLAGTARASAMMDLSDGLAADLPRLASASGCGFEVHQHALPRRRGCTIHAALCDGEDYELLAAIPAARVDRVTQSWRKAFPDLPLTEIGCLTAPAPMPHDWPAGWDHFSFVSERRARQPRRSRRE